MSVPLEKILEAYPLLEEAWRKVRDKKDPNSKDVTIILNNVLSGLDRAKVILKNPKVVNREI